MPYLASILLLLLMSTATYSQAPIYLQLEEIGSTDLIKFYPGQKIKFTTKDYPKAWRKEKIVSINTDENLLILTTGYIKPEDIHAIQLTNTGVQILGHTFSTFAAGWLVFGSYATLVDSGYKISRTEVVIGVVGATIGWLVRKLFGKKKYTMGKLYRLRIMDIRFPAPAIQTP